MGWIDNNVLNFRNSPAQGSGLLSEIPVTGPLGMLYISTDTQALYRYDGSGWVLIGGPGTGTLTGSGTVGKLAKFTGSATLGDSIVTESANLLTVNGAIDTGPYTITTTNITVNEAGVGNGSIIYLKGGAIYYNFIIAKQYTPGLGNNAVEITPSTSPGGSTFTTPVFVVDYLGNSITTTITANNHIVPGGTSAQFLKADGSVDSTVYIPTSAIGVTVQPYNANTTILGNTTTGSGSIVLANQPALILPSFTAIQVTGGIASLPTGSGTLIYSTSLSGTTNYIPKYNSSTTLNNSIIYQDGNYIGINYTTPTTLGGFVINNDYPFLQLVLGDTTTPSINAGIYLRSTVLNGISVASGSALGFYGAGGGITEWARFFSNGNFILNSTTDLNYKLQVFGDAVFTTSGLKGVTIKGYQTNNFVNLNNILSTGNNSFSLVAGLNGVGYDGFSIYDNNNNISRFVIDINGNIFTSNRLNVNGATDNSSYALNVTGQGNFSTLVSIQNRTFMYAGGLLDNTAGTGIYFGNDGLFSTDGNGNITSKDLGSSATGWDRLYHKQFFATTTGNYFGAYNSTNINGGYYTFETSSTVLADFGTSINIFGAGDANTFGINARGARSLLLGTNNTKQVEINSSGNVLINTTTNTYKLNVAGGIYDSDTQATLNQSKFGVFGGMTFTATGTETSQYINAGIAGGYVMAAAGSFTPLAKAKQGAIVGSYYMTAASTVTGIQNAIYANCELASSGTITTLATIRAGQPDQFSGGSAFTGTITNMVGIYIDDISGSSLASKFTNKYGIYQVGTSDKNFFGGEIILGSGQVVSASTTNTNTNKIKLIVNGTTYYLLASTSAT